MAAYNIFLTVLVTAVQVAALVLVLVRARGPRRVWGAVGLGLLVLLTMVSWLALRHLPFGTGAWLTAQVVASVVNGVAVAIIGAALVLPSQRRGVES